MSILFKWVISNEIKKQKLIIDFLLQLCLNLIEILIFFFFFFN